MKIKNKLYYIKEVSKIFKELGIHYNRATVRKYVKKGLLKASRLDNGYLVYQGKDIREFIKNYFEKLK